MADIRRIAVALAALLLTSATPVAQPAPALSPIAPPPVAKKSPRVLDLHGYQRIDQYGWLRDKNDPDVLAYLTAENAYADARLARIRPLVEELREEMDRRADGADESPEFTDSGYVYRRRIAAGARFPIIVRRRPQPGSPEQVVLDTELLAAGHEQYDLAHYVVSPDNNHIAFAVDFLGNRSHRVFVHDILTGQVTDTGIRDAAPDLVFAADSKSLFYARLEAGTVRSFQLWRHLLGSGTPDTLVYEETDPIFELGLSRTKSGRFILLNIKHQRTTETRYLAADRPADEFKVMEPRRRGVIYEADHLGDRFYLRTNLDAPDFRLVSVPEAAPQAANWVDVIAGSPGHLIAEFSLFDTFIAIVEEHDAIQSVRVIRRADGREIVVPRPAAIGVMDVNFAAGLANRDPAATILQLRFSGPAQPRSGYDFNTLTGELLLRKKSRAWNWFDSGAYQVERITAAAADGESIPVTLVYRKDLFRRGGNPILVTGYGAYGSSTLPRFPDSWVSLIDRGFVYAIAHVRGGGEKGRRWHDEGSLLKKRNSFTDFIAATEALVANGFADRQRIFAHGASAGGLLVAAVADLRPDLYRGIVAEVPSVDVITTASDPTIPLTTLEYEEWGNPAIKEQYDYMLSYSPYDNVAARAYPAMLVTAALHDSQVGYQEPAKWVARLRATKTDHNELLFVTNMTAGHSGIAGRFGSTDEEARIMAWLIAQSR